MMAATAGQGRGNWRSMAMAAYAMTTVTIEEKPA